MNISYGNQKQSKLLSSLQWSDKNHYGFMVIPSQISISERLWVLYYTVAATD